MSGDRTHNEGAYARTPFVPSSEQGSARRSYPYVDESTETSRDSLQRMTTTFQSASPSLAQRESYETASSHMPVSAAFVPYEARFATTPQHGTFYTMATSSSLPSMASSASTYPASHSEMAEASASSNVGSSSLSNRSNFARMSSTSFAGKNTRARVTMACIHCRSRKIRCDGRQPSCSTCTRLGRSCHYENISEEENAIVREKKRRNREAKQSRLDALSRMGVPAGRRSGAPDHIAMPAQARMYSSGPFTAPAYPSVGGLPSTYAFSDVTGPSTMMEQSYLQRGAAASSDYMSASSSLAAAQEATYFPQQPQVVPSSSWQTVYGSQQHGHRLPNANLSQQMYIDVQQSPLSDASVPQQMYHQAYGNTGSRRRGVTMNEQDLRTMQGASRPRGGRNDFGGSGDEWTSGAPGQHFELPASGRHEADAGDAQLIRGNKHSISTTTLPSVLAAKPIASLLPQPSTAETASIYHAHTLGQEFIREDGHSFPGNRSNILTSRLDTDQMAMPSHGGNELADSSQTLLSRARANSEKSCASSDQLGTWQRQQHSSSSSVLAACTPPLRPLSAHSSSSSAVASSLSTSVYSSPAISQHYATYPPPTLSGIFVDTTNSSGRKTNPHNAKQSVVEHNHSGPRTPIDQVHWGSPLLARSSQSKITLFDDAIASPAEDCLAQFDQDTTILGRQREDESSPTFVEEYAMLSRGGAVRPCDAGESFGRPGYSHDEYAFSL